MGQQHPTQIQRHRHRLLEFQFLDSQMDPSCLVQWSHSNITLSFDNSRQCKALAAAIVLLRDPNVLKGQSSLRKSQLLHRAHLSNCRQQSRLLRAIHDFAEKAGI
jgi:hypothetical protein